MNVRRSILVFGTVLVGALAVPVIAHHASGPFYDATKKVEITGTVVKLAIKNPHSFLWVNVDEKGQKVEWQIELGTGAQLARNNLTVDTLKPGIEIKVAGQPSRADGSHGMCCITLLMKSDGSAILRGTPPRDPQ